MLPGTPSGSYLLGGFMTKWIDRFPLRIINNEEENDEALKILSEIIPWANAGKLSEDEINYYQVLSVLIGKFESETYCLGECWCPGCPGNEGEMLMKASMEIKECQH